MKDWAREVGQTVREALQSWPGTVRLTVLILAVAAVIWTYYHSR